MLLHSFLRLLRRGRGARLFILKRGIGLVDGCIALDVDITQRLDI